ncbi:MAG: S26 family signal peptidase [Planctomycetota bacterium]
MSTHPTTLAMLRDAVVVAAVAVLTVQALRRWCGDRYLVPSDSMQPVLYGDPEDGDVVYVDKLASAASCRRGDLVVVENPAMPGHQLVKRIAASGDDALCWIDILKGDIWLGESKDRMRREVKQPRAAMERSVTWAVAGDSRQAHEVLDMRAAEAVQDGPWVLPPMARGLADVRSGFRVGAHEVRHREPADGVLPRGTIGTSQPVDATFLDAKGVRSLGGDDVSVADCGMELALSKRPKVLLLSIDSSDFATTFVWNGEGNTLQVWVDGRVVSEQNGVLQESWNGEVAFGRLDGRDFVMLGPTHEFVLETPGVSLLPRPRTWLHVGVVGEEDARIDRLRVFRDVFSYREPVNSIGEQSPWPKFVRKGHWFLLGDNAFDSRDSRQIGDVPIDNFLGKPTYVIGPWGRARKLPR